LVPNFRNYGAGAFAIEKYNINKLTLEGGLRYDYRWLRVYQLNNTSLETYHTTHDYNNVTGTLGATYKFSNKFSLNFNVGKAWRAPSVNELYINGIHLSAASYEKGDSLLTSEQSYNFTLSANYESPKFSAELVGYDNLINNYIYAKPSLQPITLISGTYPYFVYTQANVDLKGFDLDLTYRPFTRWSVESKTSVVRGWNKTIKDYLIFMPADRFDNTLKYSIGKWKKFSDLYISLQNITVARQTRVPPNSDYVPPPAGYSLLNANLGFATKLGKKALTIDLGASNFTNVAYRDYLNRFRYYADDIGVSFILRTKLDF
ncbi:MAG: TonB-dependent receptor domain-containing protein, partial [Ginsengibacter sp.]